MLARDKVFLGITPTVWVNDDNPLLGNDTSFLQIISEMALAGFEGSSVGHKYPTDVAVLKQALDLRGLRISEPWASTYFTACDMEQQTLDSFVEQMTFIKAMGGTDVVVAELGHAVHQQPIAVLPNKPHFSNAQWNALSGGLNRLGKLADAAGMRLCYHHHVGTGVQQRSEIDRLMAETDPETVHLLFDSGHAYYAGEDPLDLLRTHIGRTKHVHLKNVRKSVLHESKQLGRSFLSSVEEGVFTVPGDPDGALDFGPILQVLDDNDYAGWLVVEAEQDPAKANPLKYAKMARAYLRDTTGL
jgi:inosose dehydratase